MTWQRHYYMKDDSNVFDIDETPSRKPRVIAFIVVFLLLLVAIGFAANYFFNNKTTKIALIPTPTVAATPTQAPTDTPAVTPSGTISPTTKATAKTTITPTPAKSSDVTVEVLNGSGVVGAAGKMAASLKSLGYTVSDTGNADNYNYKNVVIEVKKTEPKILTKLKTDLSTDYTVGTTSATLADTNSTDAIVIVGQ